MSRVYLYAIIPSTEQRQFDAAGLSPADPGVRTIVGEALAAVVGASPAADFRALPREQAVTYLLAHQRVIEAVMRTSPALPVKFGTTLPDDAAVSRLLARGADILAPPLAELAEHVQVELVVTWNLADVLKEIAAEDGIARLKAEIEAAPAAVANDLRVALGRVVKGSIDARRDAYRERIRAALRPVAADMVENPLMDDRMIVNLALLLPEGSDGALDERLLELDGEFDGRLDFRSIGPLAPYSFATVEVSLPSFEAIDRARRALCLGDTARLAEVKSAYHRLIRQSHPDLSDAEDATDRQVARLTDAYRTLLRYAEALPPADGGSRPADGGYRFDRGSVEGAILVAVRREATTGAVVEVQP